MPLQEEHFLGFDPRHNPVDRTQACPQFSGTAYIVWFEAYSFTAWQAGIWRNTGISYLYAYQGFDICGNMVKFPPSDVDIETFSWAGNRTVYPWEQITKFNDWLAQARRARSRFNFPAPGTIMFTNKFHAAAGWRA